MEFDYGIVSFDRYLKEEQVSNEYLEKYSWVKSIIIFAIPYQNVTLEGNYLPAKFAYLSDYHNEVKDLLIIEAKRKNLDKYEVLVDVSFLNEKKVASLAGLGFIGKNTLFISRKYGAFVFLGEIITSTELKETSEITKSFCDGCNNCVNACPNKALDNGFNKNKCLSYLTQKASNNFSYYDKARTYYGCDICQDVCPYNKKNRLSQYDDKAILNLEKFENIDDYSKYSSDKTYNWIGYLKMLRNILVMETNNKNITIEKIEFYQNKYKDVKWFYDHLEYLKEKLKEE